MRRLGRDVAALLLGAAMVAGGVPTPAIAEAIGRATAREEGVVTESEDVRAEDAEAVEVAPEAEAGPGAADPSEPESGEAEDAPEAEADSEAVDPSEPEAAPAPSLADALPDLLPEGPSGDPATEALGAVEYVDEDGNALTCYDYTDISAVKSGNGNALQSGWYVVRSDFSFPEYTLDIIGDVNLVLCDGVTLNCAHGIRNAKDLGSLTIWGQEKGAGKLVADAREVDGAAGIGGFGEDEDGGTLVVHGGHVEAYGGDDAAGIGGSDGGSGGSIRILGGEVYAWADEYEKNEEGNAAAIGGGSGGSGGDIVISGGHVEATCASDGAAIGGGDDGSGGTITVLGGRVVATQKCATVAEAGEDNSGAAIGGGEAGSSGTITIAGGVVTATGNGEGGAGIGGGEEAAADRITITGGVVTAIGGKRGDIFIYTNGGAGIGGGNNGDAGTITITGGEVEAHATSPSGAAGIGGGDWGDGGHIAISGGDVTAYGGGACTGDGGAGIGCGNSADGGTIEISGGVVRAFGESKDYPAWSGQIMGSDDGNGAGIGCGDAAAGYYDAATITISGGEVHAEAGLNAAAIGGGHNGDGGDITITGGIVEANAMLVEKKYVYPGYDKVDFHDVGAGIGAGDDGEAGKITITGGDVRAYGGYGCAGIGSGEDEDGGEVTIRGGVVVAKGGPVDDKANDNKKEGAGAGIGGGSDASGGHISIYGGIVEAQGGYQDGYDSNDYSYSGAGIGGGDDGDGGTIEIHGGEVHAWARYSSKYYDDVYGAGIGGGDDGDAGSITVDGGHVVAQGYQAIGHGEDGDGGPSVDYSTMRVLSGAVDKNDVELTGHIDEGTCGGCAWTLSRDGALTIAPADGVSGTLDEAYACGSLAFPWLEHAGEIRSVAFRDGVALPEQAGSMFYDCSNLTSVDASRCDASGATHMDFMFSGCSSLASLDLSGWNASGVYVVSYMFENCSSLAALDLFAWKPQHEHDASAFRAFRGCSSLTSLDLSGWDVSRAENVSRMFEGCTSLSQISVGEGFDASRAFPEATSDARGWWSVADGRWYTVDEISLDRAHVADTYLADLPTCGGCVWSISKVGALTVTPADGASGALADADRSGDFAFPWLAHRDAITSVAFAPGVSLPMDSSSMFEDCGRLESVEASHVDASKVESTRSMFSGCSSLASLDLSAWGVSGAAYDVSHMFEGCASLASLDLSGWKARGVFNAVGAFGGCSSLASLDLSGWELSRFMLPSNMGRMFDGCASLSELTVGEGFDASRAFPKATSDTGKWWSVADGAWYTVEKIASERAHVADTYLGFEPQA